MKSQELLQKQNKNKVPTASVTHNVAMVKRLQWRAGTGRPCYPTSLSYNREGSSEIASSG
jgi:hypothetical protein